MKKALVGGFLSLVGSIWAMVIMLVAGNNLVTEWNTEAGRFWSTVTDLRLMFPFILAAVIAVIGIIVMVIGLIKTSVKLLKFLFTVCLIAGALLFLRSLGLF